MNISYTDGSRGTATVETGKHGGAVAVLRKGYPVAAETVAGIKVEHLSAAVLESLGVTDPFNTRNDIERTLGRGSALSQASTR